MDNWNSSVCPCKSQYFSPHQITQIKQLDQKPKATSLGRKHQNMVHFQHRSLPPPWHENYKSDGSNLFHYFFLMLKPPEKGKKQFVPSVLALQPHIFSLPPPSRRNCGWTPFIMVFRPSFLFDESLFFSSQFQSLFCGLVAKQVKCARRNNRQPIQEYWRTCPSKLGHQPKSVLTIIRDNFANMFRSRAHCLNSFAGEANFYTN